MLWHSRGPHLCDVTKMFIHTPSRSRSHTTGGGKRPDLTLDELGTEPHQIMFPGKSGDTRQERRSTQPIGATPLVGRGDGGKRGTQPIRYCRFWDLSNHGLKCDMGPPPLGR